MSGVKSMVKFDQVEKAFKRIPLVKCERKKRPQTGYFRDGGRGIEEVLIIQVGKLKLTLDEHCWRYDIE